MTRRILAIVVALVLAGLGTAGVLVYALSADERARAAIGDPKTVVVAKQRIAAGTTGAEVRAQDLTQEITYPSTSVPYDALPSVSAEFDDKVVTSDIDADQILRKANFGGSSSFSSGLPALGDKVAVAFETDAVGQVAGYARAGAEVVILVTDSAPGKKDCKRTRVLIPRVKILAVGPYAPPANDGARGSAMTTLGGGARGTDPAQSIIVGVNTKDALRLTHAKQTGTLSLGLLSDNADLNVDEAVGCEA
jgi:pilus assembly protein CpaB